MEFTFLNLWLFFLLWFCVFNIHAEDRLLTLGYLESGLKDLNDTDKQIALKILANELTRDSNTELSVVPIKSMQEMINLIKDGKLNYSIINSYYYLENSKILQPFLVDDLWAIQRSNEPKESYVLLINKNIEYKNIKSLEGKRLSTNTDYLMSNFYLKYLIKKSTQTPLENFFNSIKHTKTASQAVLDVFFNKSDVCLVPEYILDLVSELNPAVKQNLYIVHHSEANFIPALVLTFNNTKEKNINQVWSHMLTLADTIRGQEVLNLFNIKNITKIKHDSLGYMLSIYQEYQNIYYNKMYVDKTSQ